MDITTQPLNQQLPNSRGKPSPTKPLPNERTNELTNSRINQLPNPRSVITGRKFVMSGRS